MKNYILIATLLSLCLSPAVAVVGVDVSSLVSTSSWECLKQSGFEFSIVRAWLSFGAMESYAVQNINNAKAGGIQYVDVYMFPCGGKSASNQVNDMISGLSGADYGMVWIDIEVNPSSGCSWASYSYSSNCEYIQSLIKAVKGLGKSVGVYTSEYEWESVVGSRTACPEAADGGVQLWYAHYDNNPSFSDFRQIGGWTSPNIKQYAGDATACGEGIDKNYYP